MHFTRVFCTEQCRCFTHSVWKVTVRMLFIFVYKILEWTCHWTKCKYFFIHFFVPHYEHSIFVVIPVSRNLVKVRFCHKWCSCTNISPFLLFQVFNPSLEFHNHLCSLRCEKRQSLSDYINRCEKSHFTTKFIMITHLDVF